MFSILMFFSVHLAMFGVVTILSLAINTASGLAAPSTGNEMNGTSVHVTVYAPRGFVSARSAVFFSDKNKGRVSSKGFSHPLQVYTYGKKHECEHALSLYIHTMTLFRMYQSIVRQIKMLKLNTVFDLIVARGAYVNLFSTTSAKRSSSGQ